MEMGRPPKGQFQDVRIRAMSVVLCRRLKAALTSRGETLGEWFILQASRTAMEYESSMKKKGDAA
jgi:hypothetical protein